MNNKIYVGNLAWEIENDDLRNAFLEVGNVVDALVVKNRRGRSKGFGFVEFETSEAAQAAITQMNGKELQGRAMVIREARPPRTDNEPVAEEAPAAVAEKKTAKVPAEPVEMVVEAPSVPANVMQGEVTLGQTTEVSPVDEVAADEK